MCTLYVDMHMYMNIMVDVILTMNMHHMYHYIYACNVCIYVM